MAFSMVADTMRLVDEGNLALVNTVSARVMAAVAPWVLLGVVLSFFSVWIAMQRAPERFPLDEWVKKLAFTYGVIMIALGAGLYQGSIAPWLMTMWDKLAAFLVPGTVNTASMIDSAAEFGANQLSQVWAHASIYSASGWVMIFTSFILLAAFALIIGLGTVYVVIAKVGIGILTALGPLFIASLVTAATARFFTLWLAQWINYGLIIVVVSVVFTGVATMIGNYFGDLNMDEDSVVLSLLGAMVLSGGGAYFLVKVNSMVAGLAGGASLGGFLNEYRTGRGALGGALGSTGRPVAVPYINQHGAVAHSIQQQGRAGLLGMGSRAAGAGRAALSFVRR